MTAKTDLPSMPERFDCTNGSAQWCYGCYTMTRDDLGDYVLAEDYDALRNASEALQAEVEALRAEVERLRADRGSQEQQTAHPAITHCDNCGCDWLDNGLNPIGCHYCKQSGIKE